jgi:arylsulfatase A-like enzyme
MIWRGIMDHSQPVVALQLVAVLFAARSWSKQGGRLLAAVLVVTAPVVIYVYSELTANSAFRGYAPLIAWHAVMFLVVVAGTTQALGLARSQRRSMLCAAAGIIGGVVALSANYIIYPHRYPTFHIAMINSALLMLWAGFINVLSLVPVRARRPSHGVVALLACIQGVAVAVAAPAAPQLSAIVHEYSVLGHAGATQHGALDEVPCATQPEPFPVDEALALFAKHSGLPQLPDDFRLNDHNILLIVTDTLRYDQTSESNPDLDTTPLLSRFAGRGAFRFSHAYAPAASTGPTMCSMLSMTHPSHVSMDVTKRTPWRVGPLGDGPHVPGLLSSAGYNTFAAVHVGATNCLDSVGLFESHEVFQEVYSPTMDESLADSAIRQLRENAEQRFFGWVFFVSPHDEYLDRGSSDASAMERYRGEIRYADRQFGRVMEALGEGGLDNTVVIFMSDHGEEFGERGRHHHGQTLYTQSVHVPLVVWVPGVTGTTVDEPTSLTYLFLWLFLHGDEPLRQIAEKVVREDIAPAMELTQGAVVSERLVLGEMRVALSWDKFRIHHNTGIGSYELYDLHSDPGELRDIYWDDPARAETYRKRLEAYLRQRGCQRRYRIPSP